MTRLRRAWFWLSNKWERLLDHLFRPPMKCDHPGYPLPPIVEGIYPADHGTGQRLLALTCRQCRSTYTAPAGPRFFQFVVDRNDVVHDPMNATKRTATSTAESRVAP